MMRPINYFTIIHLMFFIAYVAADFECFCKGHCPDHTLHNGTCRTSSFCFVVTEEVHDLEANIFDIEHLYGCLPPEETGLMQCMQSDKVPHDIPKAIRCCKGDNCNIKLEPPVLSRRTPPPRPVWNNWWIDEHDVFNLVLLVLFICIVALAIIILCNLKRKKRDEAACKDHDLSQMSGRNPLLGGCSTPSTANKIPLSSGTNSTPLNEQMCLSQLIDASMTSGSGSGLPHLIQKTIAREIRLEEIVGKGRYGSVWRGTWRDEQVAVKIFHVREEASAARERTVYEKMFLHHEFILRYIASDIRVIDHDTQFLLITDYHHLGSLHDVLICNPLSVEMALRLMRSAASGLSFLHTEIHGKQIKPAIAHRDIKSKNILVKQDGTCCLADFGLAVAFDSREHRIDIPNSDADRVGTKRYMAPEILAQTIQRDSMEAFKAADMYSFALVLWEIISRVDLAQEADTTSSNESSDESANASSALPSRSVDEYRIPYYEFGLHDPSFDEMKKIVVIDGARPTFRRAMYRNATLERVITIVNELWAPNPATRLSALRVQKSLTQIFDQYQRTSTGTGDVRQTSSAEPNHRRALLTSPSLATYAGGQTVSTNLSNSNNLPFYNSIHQLNHQLMLNGNQQQNGYGNQDQNRFPFANRQSGMSTPAERDLRLHVNIPIRESESHCENDV